MLARLAPVDELGQLTERLFNGSYSSDVSSPRSHDLALQNEVLKVCDYRPYLRHPGTVRGSRFLWDTVSRNLGSRYVRFAESVPGTLSSSLSTR